MFVVNTNLKVAVIAELEYARLFNHHRHLHTSELLMYRR